MPFGMVMQKPGTGMSDQRGGSHALDDCCCTDNAVAAGAGERAYGGFVHPRSLHRGGCPAGGQSQSGGYGQPEAQACIAKSRPKARSQTEARPVNGTADTVKDDALRTNGFDDQYDTHYSPAEKSDPE